MSSGARLPGWLISSCLALGAAAAMVGLPASVAAAADAVIRYGGATLARTSGNRCREVSPTSNGLAYTKSGARNVSGSPTSVLCPITRRNSTPVGSVERADSSPQAAFVPTAKLDKLSVDVRFTPDAAATACTVYGRLPGPLGGVFFSSTLSTCVKNTTDCSGGERTQTLSWKDPFAGTRVFINLGVRCELRQGAGIVGSVAAFSGDLVPAAGGAP